MRRSCCGSRIPSSDRYLGYVLLFTCAARSYAYNKHLNSDHVCFCSQGRVLSDQDKQFTYAGMKHLRDPPEEDNLGGTRKKKKKDLYHVLMKQFSKIKEPEKADVDTYSIIHTTPSLVPNPFVPAIRVWGYNVSGLTTRPFSYDVKFFEMTSIRYDADDNNAYNTRMNERADKDEGIHNYRSKPEDVASNGMGKKKKDARPGKKRCKRLEDKRKWWCNFPEREWYSDEKSPSRKNGPLAPLGYTQVSVVYDVSFCFLLLSIGLVCCRRNGVRESRDVWVAKVGAFFDVLVVVLDQVHCSCFNFVLFSTDQAYGPRLIIVSFSSPLL